MDSTSLKKETAFLMIPLIDYPCGTSSNLLSHTHTHTHICLPQLKDIKLKKVLFRKGG